MWFELERGTLEWVARAPQTHHARADLAADPEEVFEVLADVDQWPNWHPNVESAEWTSSKEGGAGSSRLVELDIGEATEEFLKWEPGRRLTFTVTAATFPGLVRFVEDYRLAGVGRKHCRLWWDISWEPAWYAIPFVGLLRGAMDRMMRRSVASLTAHIRDLGFVEKAQRGATAPEAPQPVSERRRSRI